MDETMIQLRSLVPNDEAVVAAWPPYPAEFEALDYALREAGWLAEFRSRPETWRYAAVHAGELVGFSILATTAPGEAEFRIALHPDKAGQGLGRIVTARTLEVGFNELGLMRIHLIVRQNNRRAIALYRHFGFVLRGQCRRQINGRLIPFFLMDLDRRDGLQPRPA